MRGWWWSARLLWFGWARFLWPSLPRGRDGGHRATPSSLSLRYRCYYARRSMSTETRLVSGWWWSAWLLWFGWARLLRLLPPRGRNGGHGATPSSPLLLSFLDGCFGRGGVSFVLWTRPVSGWRRARSPLASLARSQDAPCSPVWVLVGNRVPTRPAIGCADLTASARACLLPAWLSSYRGLPAVAGSSPAACIVGSRLNSEVIALPSIP